MLKRVRVVVEMVEVEVKKKVSPSLLERVCRSEVLAYVDGDALTVAKAHVLYEFYKFAGDELVQRWKFRDQGPFAKAYDIYLYKHLKWLARHGLLEEGEGPYGGIAYRVTKEGVRVLILLGLL